MPVAELGPAPSRPKLDLAHLRDVRAKVGKAQVGEIENGVLLALDAVAEVLKQCQGQ